MCDGIEKSCLRNGGSDGEIKPEPLFTDGKPHSPREITRAYAEYRYRLYKEKFKNGK